MQLLSNPPISLPTLQAENLFINHYLPYVCYHLVFLLSHMGLTVLKYSGKTCF